MRVIKPCKYDIRFEGVGFSYLEGEPVLEGIDFYVPEKSRLALVGPPSSGKSTITALIARFWDVQYGSVKIGGVDVRDIDPQQIYGMISEVFQDVYLFEDSIYNNIRLGRMNATEKEILEAAEKAMVLDFAWDLREGIHTRVGKAGGNFSGRQKQCIGIARALLKNAPIVLLDETEACMDLKNEVYMQEAIDQLLKDRTVVIAARRLTTALEADHIVVLNGGRVREQGTHQELMEKNGS